MFFISPYEDELLYSVIARYHKRSGNIYYSHTTEDVYGKKLVRSSVYLPSNISNLINNISNRIDIDEYKIIQNHTLYPFYTAFMSEEKAQKVFELMKGENGSKIYTTVGICATTISTPIFLKFCQKCFYEDTKKYGEPYWHRVHQVPGVKLCPKHKSILLDSTVKINSFNKQEYITPSYKNCNMVSNINYSKGTIEKLYKLSKNVEYLLSTPNNKKSYDWYRNNYINYLKSRDLANPKGKVRLNKLILEFKEFYGDEFLELLESDIKVGSKSNWIRNIYSQMGNTTHVIRQLLFIQYLDVNIDAIFKYSYEFKPFGDGPWPCLNMVCNNYKKDIIKNISISYSKSNHRITGTLVCECGYKYLKQYNINHNKKYEKTKVLEFGDVWEKKLMDLVISNELSINDMSKKLGLDYCSLRNRITKLKLHNSFDESNNAFKNYENKSDNHNRLYNTHDNDYIYRNELLNILNENPKKTRMEIRSLNPKIYTYLLKYDRDWLEKQLPPKIKNRTRKSNVDWGKRDIEILKKVKVLIANLNKIDDKPRWININMIGKSLDIYHILNNSLDKLPNTKVYLEKIIKTKDEYKLQKIKWAINFIAKNNYENLNISTVSHKSGVSTKNSKWKEIIKEEIESYNKILDIGEK